MSFMYRRSHGGAIEKLQNSALAVVVKSLERARLAGGRPVVGRLAGGRFPDYHRFRTLRTGADWAPWSS